MSTIDASTEDIRSAYARSGSTLPYGVWVIRQIQACRRARPSELDPDGFTVYKDVLVSYLQEKYPCATPPAVTPSEKSSPSPAKEHPSAEPG